MAKQVAAHTHTKRSCVTITFELGFGSAGAKNPEFAKISIWLQTGGNFKKYDKRGIGVIEESAFEDAINRFLDEHWKYEGVLW